MFSTASIISSVFYYPIDSVNAAEVDGQRKVDISGIDASKLSGKHVILVEDFIDTGRTLTGVLEYMRRDVGAASVRVAALLEKRSARSSGYRANYVGYSVPDKFVVGFGIDYNDCFRNLSHIAVLNKVSETLLQRRKVIFVMFPGWHRKIQMLI
jgi:hypoxanthine phosphoribosyltransferase